MASGLSEAVVAIHAVGVTHRDLKPANGPLAALELRRLTLASLKPPTPPPFALRCSPVPNTAN